MFDRQLTMDGREEDIAPKHEQPRMFEFPKTMKGQTTMDTDGPMVARILSHDGTVREVPVPDDFPFPSLTQGPCGHCAGTGRREFPVPRSHPKRIMGIGPFGCHDCRATGLTHVHETSRTGRLLLG